MLVWVVIYEPVYMGFIFVSVSAFVWVCLQAFGNINQVMK